MSKSKFAVNIHYLRNQQRLTRKAAAHLSGIPLSSWSSYEEGRAFPHWTKMPAICRVLHFSDVLALIEKDISSMESANTDTAMDPVDAIREIHKLVLQAQKKS